MGEQLTLADISLAPFAARIYLLEKHRGFTLHKDDLELESKQFSEFVGVRMSDTSTRLG